MPADAPLASRDCRLARWLLRRISGEVGALMSSAAGSSSSSKYGVSGGSVDLRIMPTCDEAELSRSSGRGSRVDCDHGRVVLVERGISVDCDHGRVGLDGIVPGRALGMELECFIAN